MVHVAMLENENDRPLRLPTVFGRYVIYVVNLAAGGPNNTLEAPDRRPLMPYCIVQSVCAFEAEASTSVCSLMCNIYGSGDTQVWRPVRH